MATAFRQGRGTSRPLVGLFRRILFSAVVEEAASEPASRKHEAPGDAQRSGRIPGLPPDVRLPHLTKDGTDPFPDREDLYAELDRVPRHLRDHEGSTTWYSGPRGFTAIDVVKADDEELRKYERVVKLLLYDRERYDKALRESSGQRQGPLKPRHRDDRG